MGIQVVHLAPQLFRKPDIIRIQKSDELPPRRLYPFVSCPGDPLVLLIKIPYPVPIGIEDFPGVIGGAVIDDDDLKIPVGLRQNRLDRLCYDISPVKRRDNNAYAYHRFTITPNP